MNWIHFGFGLVMGLVASAILFALPKIIDTYRVYKITRAIHKVATKENETK